MKKYLEARTRITALLMAGALGLFIFSAPQAAQAQNAPEKIRLMAETLRARDAGDIQLAKERAEELIKIAPKDVNVQRLLASINGELERRGMGAAVYGQAAEQTVEAAMQPEVEAEVVEVAEVVEPEEPTAEEISIAAATELAEAGDLSGAETVLEDYFATGGDSKAAKKMAHRLAQQMSDPYAQDIAEISPNYVAQHKIIRDLTARGRAQFLNGDYTGASATFKEIEARDTNNAEAKLFQLRIAEIIGAVQQQNLYKTRAQMLTEVDQGWERPKVYDVGTDNRGTEEADNSIQRKMNAIVIPQVNFSGMSLTRVIESLSALSAEYDPENVGVNIVPLFNSNDKNPQVNITLRNLSLDRILQFVTQQVSFSYDVGADAVTVAPSDSAGGVSTTVTEFFPISRATVIRLTGFRDNGGSSGGGGAFDPFATPAASSSSSNSGDAEVEALQTFFQRAGVNFEMAGASLAFDGEQLIVTQTRRNLERMRTILRNYNEVKQVEIEAKFLEVSQSDLDELGFDWTYSDGAGRTVFTTANNRSLSSGFTGNSGSSAINISTDAIAGSPQVVSASAGGTTVTTSAVDPIPSDSFDIPAGSPVLPGTIDFAQNVLSSVFSDNIPLGGEQNIALQIRALSRKTGSDLMSAPKVTVLSGKRASITVAQEMRYPETYGDIESTASTSGSSTSSSGSAAISITAGTPQDFATRNVGVELSVTPNVENDDTISLKLEPKVTEFEGFVEYGGPSVALSGGTTVTVPPGFYQPIFSVREILTEVTVFDGATVVMGGLTRDEVKTVKDSVPILGDIPGLGRLFRSEGETRQKRNLLIFVTANLVSPGGSPARQNYRNVNANSLFQNPTIMTPAGNVSRGIEASVE